MVRVKFIIVMSFVFAVFTLCGCAQKTLQFERIKIADTKFEAASVFDVDKDGAVDIVSGEYWYAGPDFKKQHKICKVRPEGEYFDDFSDYPMDVDGDGYDDIITGGFWGGNLRWRQNPKGKTGLWKINILTSGIICVETTRFWDVDGDGQTDVVPNTIGGDLCVYTLVTGKNGKGTGKFLKRRISSRKQGHGLGFGDINSDGRGDFIVPDGWFEAPQKPFEQQWSFHQDFKLGTASVPILVYDVNEDGLADLIVGEAHNYGLYWMEQRIDKQGRRSWVKHNIDTERSQYHDIQLVDIDNDGKVELVTGKRYRAHNGHDPGGDDPIGTYYFEINDGKFERFTLDYGPAQTSSGVGIYFWVEDITGNGFKDIVAPGKEGLYLFKNLGLIE